MDDAERLAALVARLVRGVQAVRARRATIAAATRERHALAGSSASS